MKYKIFLLGLLLIIGNISAQTYLEKTIKDIQYLPSSQLLVPPHDYPSSLNGDTVTVVGIMMCPPYEGANPDSIRTLHSGAPAVYLQDTSETEWSGIICRFENATPIFEALDSGTVIRATGVVSEYYTTTQFNLIDFQAEDIIGIRKRPEPVLLTLDSLVEMGTSNPNYLAEKWEGVYVEIRDVSTSDPGAIGYNTFSIYDQNNSSIIVGTNSDFWRRKLPPLPGTKLDMIRGYIETRNNIAPHWFMINPIFEEDIEFGDILPPNIFGVERDKGIVNYGDQVIVTATCVDRDGYVDEATLYYNVNGGTDFVVTMIPVIGDTVYSATIPAFNDSTLISYYVEAVDDQGATSTSPTNYQTNRYFYWVLDRDLAIQDVQKSPFGTGFSAYDSYEVTVRGVVTADTSGIPGFSPSGPQIYIQNGTGEWSGIQIFGTEVLKLKVGDDVTVTGIVDEEFFVTRIEDLNDPAKIVINGTADVPAPTVLSTSDINGLGSGDMPAEAYEGVLIKYENVSVIDENADGEPGPDQGTSGNRNFGEMFIADNSNVQTRVELQDGGHSYHNFWDAALENEPIRIYTGDSFDAITGILFYSFSNYKLIPRTDADFEGFTTSTEENENLPLEYSLAQNYPNPFNPSTRIEFTIPAAGFVKVQVYNLLGQTVRTLINNDLQAGKHSVEFQASDLSSGIYFYRIESGNFSSVKKMMLIK